MASSYNHNIYDYIIGDYNNDGVCDQIDAQDCLEIYNKLSQSEMFPPFPLEDYSGQPDFTASRQQVFCSDVDGDGEITSTDAQRILMYHVNNEIVFNPVSYDDTIRPVGNNQGLVFYGYFKKNNEEDHGKFYYDSNYSTEMRSLNKCYYYDLTDGQNNQLYLFYESNTRFIKTTQVVSISKLEIGEASIDANTGEVTSFTPDVMPQGWHPTPLNYYLDKNNKGLFIYVLSPRGSGSYYPVT